MVTWYLHKEHDFDVPGSFFYLKALETAPDGLGRVQHTFEPENQQCASDEFGESSGCVGENCQESVEIVRWVIPDTGAGNFPAAVWQGFIWAWRVQGTYHVVEGFFRLLRRRSGSDTLLSESSTTGTWGATKSPGDEETNLSVWNVPQIDLIAGDRLVLAIRIHVTSVGMTVGFTDYQGRIDDTAQNSRFTGPAFVPEARVLQRPKRGLGK